MKFIAVKPSQIPRKCFIVFLIISCGFVLYYVVSPNKRANAVVSLAPNNPVIVASGHNVYLEHCASCHGFALEGQLNWRKRDNRGYLPAPPHNVHGHTWHHSDEYLFLITKYGIEQTIGRKYKNNMPAYHNVLSDEQIIAVLSYIKSTWPTSIQKQHNQINIDAAAYR